MRIKKKFRQAEIYGITGRKGHGKDTFATEVVKAQETLVRARGKSSPKQPFAYTHFAESLKSMSSRIFGLSKAQMYDPTLKEVPFTVPLNMDAFLSTMQKETGLPDMRPAGRVANSPREVMQFFGTDYVRKTQDDYWVQRTMTFAKTQRRVLIPDTRFPNEANAVRANRGRVIKIVRLGMSDSGDAHASETEIDKIDPDLLLMVKTGNLSLVTKVATLIAGGRFSAAQKYDWRSAEKAMNAYSSGMSAEGASRLLGGGGTKGLDVLRNLLDYYDRPKRSRLGAGKVSHQTINSVVSKWCSVCSRHKPLDEFNRASKAWDGLAGWCRQCSATKNKEKYHKYSNKTMKAVFREMKTRSAKRGWDFAITEGCVNQLWAKQNGRCYYSGVELTTSISDPNKMSIDRIDSTKGYIRDNVVLCTVRINLMKRDMSMQEFLTVILRISLSNFSMLHKTREEVLQVLQSL